jgi:hypothetical protein
MLFRQYIDLRSTADALHMSTKDVHFVTPIGLHIQNHMQCDVRVQKVVMEMQQCTWEPTNPIHKSDLQYVLTMYGVFQRASFTG